MVLIKSLYYYILSLSEMYKSGRFKIHNLNVIYYEINIYK